MQNLNVYFNVSQNITIQSHGKNDVHLSGYFEPNNSMEEGLYGDELDEDKDDLDEDEMSPDEEEIIKKMQGTTKVDKKSKDKDI